MELAPEGLRWGVREVVSVEWVRECVGVAGWGGV